MLSTLSHITPILVGFLAGYALRRGGVASQSDGAFILKLVFYVCIPALVFNSLATVDITQHLLVFSLFSSLLYVVGFIVGKAVLRGLSLSIPQGPVFLIFAMGVNSIFALPYLQYLNGAPGIARYVAFDVSNTILLYTWAYAVAVRANPAHQGRHALTRKLLKSPPLYGIAVGLVVNFFDWQMPSAILNTTSAFSATTGFLVTLAIGIMLHVNRDEFSTSLRAIVVRMSTAWLVGLAIVFAFHLHGDDRMAVLLFACAPVAFSAATFAALEDLDVVFAARTLSVSLAVSIALTTTVALVFA
jgi:predicted permease